MNHPDQSFIAQDAAGNKSHVLVFNGEEGTTFFTVHGETVKPLGNGVYEVTHEHGHNVKLRTADKDAPGFAVPEQAVPPTVIETEPA